MIKLLTILSAILALMGYYWLLLTNEEVFLQPENMYALLSIAGGYICLLLACNSYSVKIKELQLELHPDFALDFNLRNIDGNSFLTKEKFRAEIRSDVSTYMKALCRVTE